MNENETLNLATSIPLIKKQFKTERIPHTTLLYGEDLNQIFNLMIEITNNIFKKNTTILNNVSDQLQEPSEDIIIINTGSSIKIEHIKQLQHRIKYGPSNHAYCIVIIQNIQKSTNSAKNALLKSIEEPPEKTIFFLSSENKYNVSATIRSRAQQFFIPNQNEPSQSDYQAMINKINEKITYISVTDFLNYTSFEKTIYIQSLPYDTNTIQDLLTAWKLDIFSKWPELSKKEHFFLQKIIEIISNIKYNLNLKLQLLAVTLQIEEDDSR